MITALPKSTFVMGAVTLALFGVAIYETATDKPKHVRGAYNLSDNIYEDEDDVDDDALEKYAQIEQERAEREVLREREKAKELDEKAALMDALVGVEQATPGDLFEGFPLDSAEMPDAARARLDAWARQTDSEIKTIDDGTKHDRFFIAPGANASGEQRDALCGRLRTILRNYWGTPYVDEYGAELWANKTAGIRAGFWPRTCQLTFDRFDEPEAWLNKSGTSTVPYGWVGKSQSAVEAAVGVQEDGGMIEWNVHGVGAGYGTTRVQAYLTNRKVSRIEAVTKVSVPTRGALEDHLRREFGKPKIVEDKGEVRLEWPSKSLVLVTNDTDNILVINGKL